MALVLAIVAGVTAPNISSTSEFWGVLAIGSARLDVASTESIVTTIVQVVVGITVAVILAPKLSDASHPYDRISANGWLVGAGNIVNVAAILAVTMTALAIFEPDIEGSHPPGWTMLPLAGIAVALAGITGRRAQDSADVAEPQRTRMRLDNAINSLEGSGIRTRKGNAKWGASLLLAVAPYIVFVSFQLGKRPMPWEGNELAQTLLALTIFAGPVALVGGVLIEMLRGQMILHHHARAAGLLYRIEMLGPWVLLTASAALAPFRNESDLLGAAYLGTLLFGVSGLLYIALGMPLGLRFTSPWRGLDRTGERQSAANWYLAVDLGNKKRRRAAMVND